MKGQQKVSTGLLKYGNFFGLNPINTYYKQAPQQVHQENP